ncbi:MAG: ATP-binding protein [Phycisphaerae bacterium]|nr:ATP-binding protein [Phycisphaerae bacterium]
MTAKEAEAARNNDVLKAVIIAMAEGLIFLTRDGKIAICNPAAKLWKKSDCINRADDSIDDFSPILAEHMKALLKGDEELDYSGPVIKFGKTGDQESYFETKGCKVKSAEGVELGYVLVGQDLTEHKKLEKNLLEQTENVTAINEMLKMSRVRMAQQEKMVAIGQMAAGIAHEIGNPLASLSSVAQYLGRKLNSHEQKEHLLIIDYQVNRISNILKRMLTLAKPATAEYKWNDINELIANTLSLVKFDKRMASVTVKDVVHPDLPMVWMNPQSFEQVLLNLLINAMDAMEAKGKQDEHILEISRAYNDGIIEIHVRDTGIGMSPDVCKRAFESFFTTKEIGKGTGLGLFISYNLVAEMDGTIEMDSEPGVGTTVKIKIPVRPKNALFSDSENGYSSSTQLKEIE